ncbi:MAG TPA: polysaccharide biosynthesis tyrosine autokinase [Longimicrobium sp.]|jgi:capsular exopolysaccharide synthesis family protein
MTEPTYAPGSSRASADTSLRDLWGTLRRRRGLVAGITAGAVALTMALTFWMSPVYESEAALRIVAEKSSAGGMLEQLGDIADLGALTGLGADDVDTELGVMRSRRMADPVAEAVGLQVELLSPRLPRSEVLKVVAAPRDRAVGVYRLDRQADGSYAARVEESKEKVALPGRVEIGTPFSVGGVTLALSPELKSSAPETVKFEIRPFREAVDELQDELVVDRQESGSRLVEVGYRHKDPEVAAAVVNGLADGFIAYKRTTSTGESRSSATVLREQVESYRVRLAEAENRLRTFRESARVLAPEAEAEQEIRRSGEMRGRFDDMRVEQASLRQLLADIRGAPRGASTSAYRKLASFPPLMRNPTVGTLLNTLTALDNERAVLLGRRTDEDEDVKLLSSRITGIEQQLLRIADDHLRSLDLQLASADQAIARVDAEMASMPGLDMQFVRLTRDVKLLNEVYLLLQARLKEAEITEAVTQDAAQVVDYGLVAHRPSSPQPLLNLVLSVVLGLMMGVAGAITRDMVDPTVRSSRDASEATGGLAVLGSIPRIRPAPRRSITVGMPRAVLPAGPDRLIARSDPRHPASEAYRALRTSLTHSSVPEETPRTVVVTSARAGEGKSTSAANLAVTLAQQGTRTLLVDADLRAGRLNALFGVRPEPGFAETLLGRAPLSEAVLEVMMDESDVPLYLLPAGAPPRNPAELLGSLRMRALVQEMRGLYDVVIFDAPSLSGLTDAAVLGKSVDATLLVVRPGMTDRDALEQALEQLRLSRAPVAGVLLNDVLNGRLV